jgi:hypothetical protein
MMGFRDTAKTHLIRNADTVHAFIMMFEEAGLAGITWTLNPEHGTGEYYASILIPTEGAPLQVQNAFFRETRWLANRSRKTMEVITIESAVRIIRALETPTENHR